MNRPIDESALAYSWNATGGGPLQTVWLMCGRPSGGLGPDSHANRAVSGISAVMARLIYASTMSLDICTEDERGAVDWAPRDDDVTRGRSSTRSSANSETTPDPTHEWVREGNQGTSLTPARPALHPDSRLFG